MTDKRGPGRPRKATPIRKDRVDALDEANALLLRRAQAAERRETLDQEVLDAMSDWPEADLRDPLDAPPASQRQAAWRALIRLCRAELLRRGLKP